MYPLLLHAVLVFVVVGGFQFGYDEFHFAVGTLAIVFAFQAIAEE